MVAAKLRSKPEKLDENNVFRVLGQPDLLTSAAIYGANASGKSNLIAAMRFMRRFVLDSPKETSATGSIPVESFLLNAATENQSSHFEIVFVIDNKRYRYGFDVTKERVTAEWLFYVSSSREAKLFKRTLDEVELGGKFKEGKEISHRTRPNALFLSIVAQFNGKIAQEIIAWFKNLKLASGLEDFGMKLFTIKSYLEGEFRQDIIKLIRQLDLGIDNLLIEKIEKNTKVSPLPDGMPDELKNALTVLREHGDVERFGVQSVHGQYNEEGQLIGQKHFDFAEQESEGTQKLFALAGPVIAALRRGHVFIIDELDARLHPLLTCQIVRLFNDKETNPHHAQLIFTTHDTNLLGSDLFRRDQIWFVEKDQEGATDLYSLAEFKLHKDPSTSAKVRNDASYERDYIKGRYGAIPLLGNFRTIVLDGEA
jgi:predicted ATP-dependent endonuclease of OLD family